MKFFRTLWGRKPPVLSPGSVDESVYRVLAEQASDALIHVGPDGLVTYASPSVEGMLGHRPDQIVGTDMRWLVAEQDRPALVAKLARLQSGEIARLRHQAAILCADGTSLWLEGSSVMSKDGTGSIILILRDIADRKNVEEQLTALALEDGLTGLANRRSFDQTLAREWLRTLREGSELSLLLLDLDHFKQFNDAYGHQAGDDCLRSVAAAMRSALSRPGDVACRYGGEEFAVILSGTSADGATQIAEQIRQKIEGLQIPHLTNSGGPVVTASIGIATAIARVGGRFECRKGFSKPPITRCTAPRAKDATAPLNRFCSHLVKRLERPTLPGRPLAAVA